MFDVGISANTSIGLDFSLIHYNAFKTDENIPGDILLNIWHFTGAYFDGIMNSGMNIVFRIPTGPDAYTNEKCRNLSFGNNELKIEPVLSFNISEHDVLIFNLSYTFREERGQSLYSGFKINPFESKTYKACLGFNPFYPRAFLDVNNLKNDYASAAAGFITSRLSPWILFTEIYYSSGFFRGDKVLEGLNIEGDNVNPLLFSAGIKYLLSESFFMQISDIVDMLIGIDIIPVDFKFLNVV